MVEPRGWWGLIMRWDALQVIKYIHFNRSKYFVSISNILRSCGLWFVFLSIYLIQFWENVHIIIYILIFFIMKLCLTKSLINWILYSFCIVTTADGSWLLRKVSCHHPHHHHYPGSGVVMEMTGHVNTGGRWNKSQSALVTESRAYR